jgi:hypothetical protein
VTGDTRFPLLWICGPAGVGKSTVSWQLYTELDGAGVPVAFADSDQLCMCYPAPPGDPDRQDLRAANVGSMIQNYRSGGARCMIVNGVLGPAGLRPGLLPDADVTICRLRADSDSVERRFTARHGQQDDLDQQLREIRAEIRLMDESSFAGVCVDTTGVPAAAVGALVRAACADWPGFTGRLARAPGECRVQRAPAPGGQLALITGPPGVGKSTVGFRFYLRCLSAGLTTGYVDLSQIGFVRPAGASDPGSQHLIARNLAAMWANFQAAGASHLVASGLITGPADLERYAAELPGTHLTLIQLQASGAEHRMRIMSRGGGGSWPEPGDRLRGQSADFLANVADQAVQAAKASDLPASGGVTIDTTSLSPDESASLIREAVGWPE